VTLAAVGAGGVLLPPFIASLAREAGTAVPEGPSLSRWLHESVGVRMALPAKDSFGQSVNASERQLLVLLPCSECSRDPLVPSRYLLTNDPSSTVFVFDGELDAVPSAFKRERAAFKLFAGKDSEFVPLEWRLRKPQVLLLVRGLVVGVPDEDETQSDYVARMRKGSREGESL